MGKRDRQRRDLRTTVSFLSVKHGKVLPRKIKWIYCKSDHLRQKQKGWCFDPQSRKTFWGAEERRKRRDGSRGLWVLESRAPPQAGLPSEDADGREGSAGWCIPAGPQNLPSPFHS